MIGNQWAKVGQIVVDLLDTEDKIDNDASVDTKPGYLRLLTIFRLGVLAETCQKAVSPTCVVTNSCRFAMPQNSVGGT